MSKKGRVKRKPEANAVRRLLASPGENGGPCTRCLRLAWEGRIRAETVMPIPLTCPPQAEDGSGPCCHDCQAADALGKAVFRRKVWASTEAGGQKRPLEPGMPFHALRICVGNERQEQLRLPEELRPHFGLVAQKLVRPSVGPNALAEHHAWLESVGIKLSCGDDEDEEG